MADTRKPMNSKELHEFIQEQNKRMEEENKKALEHQIALLDDELKSWIQDGLEIYRKRYRQEPDEVIPVHKEQTFWFALGFEFANSFADWYDGEVKEKFPEMKDTNWRDVLDEIAEECEKNRA